MPASNRKTKVFISYSRKDKAFVRKLNAAIDAMEVDAWVDWEGIEIASDWMSRISSAIEGSDAFLFVISPDSLKSTVCADELELGIKLNKKVIPILYREPEKRQKMHKKLSSTNWLYLRTRKDDFKATMPKLLDAIKTDLGWVQQHTRLLERASEWEQKNRNKSYLLQGSDLQDGEKWMAESTTNPDRVVLPLQAEYINTSRQNAVQQQRSLLVGISMAMVISIALGIFALTQWSASEKNATLAENNALTAVANEHIAATEQAKAEANEERAIQNENIAKAQRSAAQATIYENRAGELDTSTLLALESWLRVPSEDAETIIRRNLSQMPVPVQQVKHAGRIWNLHTSKDGQYLVSSSADKTACVWSISGEKKFCVEHDSDVTDALLTTDNSLLITSSLDGSVRIWDGSNGAPIAVFDLKSSVYDIDISPDNKIVTAGRDDGFISVIDLITRKEIFFINFASGPVKVVVFQPSGTWLAAGTAKGNVFIWKVMSGLSFPGPHHQDSEIFNIAFSANGEWLVSVAEDSAARVVRTENGGQKYAALHGDWVEDVAFGPDPSWFATVSDDNLVRVIDTQTGVEKLRMEHSSFVQRVEVSPNGNWILSTGYDLTARIWDAHTGGLMLEVPIEGIGSATSFSPDGNTFVVGDQSGSISIWDISSLNARIGYIEFSEYINKAKYDPAGKWMLVNVDDYNIWQLPVDQLTSLHDGRQGTKTLTFKQLTSQIKVSPDSKWVAISENSELGSSRAVLYNLETKVLHSLPHSSDITGMAISPDGKFLATTNSGNTSVYIWDIESGQKVNELKFDEEVFTISYSSNLPYLAIGFVGKIVLWDVTTNAEAAVLGQIGNIRSITFNKEGSWLATSSSDGSLFVWDMTAGDFSQPKYKFLQGGSITSLDFNSQKNWLASGSANGYAYIWNLATGQEVYRIPHVDAVSGVSFSPDGNQLATVSRKTIQIWDTNQIVPIHTEKIVEIACNRLTKNLSRNQWAFFFHEEEYQLLCPNLP